MSTDIERVLTLYNGVVSADGAGSAKETLLREKATVIVNVTAASGTTPTLVPTIEISKDNSVWHHRGVVIDHETAGVLTRTTVPTVEGKLQTTGQYQLFLDGHLGKYMRVNFAVTGTSASFTVLVEAYLR